MLPGTCERTRSESVAWGGAPRGGTGVAHDWDDDSGKRRFRRKRRRRDEEREAELAAERAAIEDEALLTPEERAYRRAARRAEEKTRFASESLPVLLVGLFLLVWIPPVGVAVLAIWGWRPAKRAYRLFVEPGLRERLVEQEVDREVQAMLSDERRNLASEHARSMQQLSASIAHEIRNPITAAKSLVQQMEEDPTSGENTEYARVALEVLGRKSGTTVGACAAARGVVGDMKVANTQIHEQGIGINHAGSPIKGAVGINENRRLSTLHI